MAPVLTGGCGGIGTWWNILSLVPCRQGQMRAFPCQYRGVYLSPVAFAQIKSVVLPWYGITSSFLYS